MKKTTDIANLATCGDLRPITRTSTFEFAIPATQGSNQHTVSKTKPYSITPIISEPHPPINLPSPEVDAFRDSMKQLLQLMLDFFEEEYRKVEEGILNEEETLLPYVQGDNTDPNLILDQYLRILSATELKILLVIIRQTNGWVDRCTCDPILSHLQIESYF